MCIPLFTRLLSLFALILSATLPSYSITTKELVERFSISIASGAAWYLGLAGETRFETAAGREYTLATYLGINYEFHPRFVLSASHFDTKYLHKKVSLKSGVTTPFPPVTDIRYHADGEMFGVDARPFVYKNFRAVLGTGVAVIRYSQELYPAFLLPSRVAKSHFSRNVIYTRGAIDWVFTDSWSLSAEYNRLPVDEIDMRGKRSVLNTAMLKLTYSFK